MLFTNMLFASSCSLFHYKVVYFYSYIGWYSWHNYLLTLLILISRPDQCKFVMTIWLWFCAIIAVYSFHSKWCQQGVNYINVICTRFSYESLLGSFFLVTFWQKSTFVQKNAQKTLMKLTQSCGLFSQTSIQCFLSQIW